TLYQWCQNNKIELLHIQPGRPMQNSYVERFNRLYREDILNAYLFEDLHQVRDLSYKWMEDYNSNHPHDALGKVSPWNYIRNFESEDNLIKKQINQVEMSKLTLSENG
ncbi:MAG: transposase, partial [Draconibacterium sp.]